MSFTTKSNLFQRLVVSTFAVPLIILIISFSTVPLFQPAFVLAIAALASLALHEFYRLSSKLAIAPLKTLGIATTIFFMGGTFLSIHNQRWEHLPMAILAAAFITAFAAFFRSGTSPIKNLAVTFFGIFYLTIPLSFLIAITYFFHFTENEQGKWWLLYLLLVAKFTDTAAYFVGRSYGRRKLCPHISPNKTVEGALAGLATAIAVSAAVSWISSNLFEVPLLTLPMGNALILGALISIFAQFGDLTESLLKRDADVKDSSQLPGLGGILDLVDSLIFTAPLLYLYLKYGVAT